MKVGIIGLGAIGERLLTSFLNAEFIKIAAICDTNLKRLQLLKERIPSAALHEDYKIMLEDKSIQLIYLAVPPKLHHSIAMDVIASGKHILCEKPLANSLIEAEEMSDAVKTAGIVHAINFPMVYSNTVHMMKEKINSGELGEIKRVELNLHFTDWPRAWQQNDWIAGREQGGFIREVTPHYIQLLFHLFEDLHVVHSLVDYPANELLCETGFISRLTAGDHIPVLFNGTAGIGQKEHLSFKIFGTKKTLDLVNWRLLLEGSPINNEMPISIPNTPHNSLIEELQKAINGQPALMIDFQEGYKIQRVLEDLL